MKVREATQPLTTRSKVAIAGAATGLALAALTTSPVLASGGVPSDSAPESASGQTPMHEQMHQMMNSMHGEGASQKMHEAMGPQAEGMMDSCASGMDNMRSMGDMENMQGMMGGGMMNGGMQSGGEGQYQDAQ